MDMRGETWNGREEESVVVVAWLRDTSGDGMYEQPGWRQGR
jgi:hypothetical protein